jgi:hypothetical protein
LDVGLPGKKKLEEFQKVNEQAMQDASPEITTSSDGSSSDRSSSDGSVKSASAPNSYNFLVTSSTLIPSLVKCLLFKLNPYFNASNSKTPALELTLNSLLLSHKFFHWNQSMYGNHQGTLCPHVDPLNWWSSFQLARGWKIAMLSLDT